MTGNELGRADEESRSRFHGSDEEPSSTFNRAEEGGVIWNRVEQDSSECSRQCGPL